MKQLNTAIKRVKDNPDLGLKIDALNRNKLRVISYADSSFANASDLATQLGFVIFLSDESKRVNWLHFRSYKCRRVVRSVLSGETHAFVDAFDSSFTLRHDLSNITKSKIPLSVITYWQSLFKLIILSSTTTEKRLMIDLQACREAYREGELDDAVYGVGWVKSENNIADDLTKLNKVDLIQKVMRTGTLPTIADQWVVRIHMNGADNQRI